MATPPNVPDPAQPTTRLSGWGANLRSDCVLVEPETSAEAIARTARSNTIARGLGRSYGDPALNAGGQVLGMSKVDRYLAFDERTGVLTCEAGVSIDNIIQQFAPRGWFPMIAPGTKYVTVGGCIANDVHGKAHHVQGSFSACVDSLRIMLASGEVVTASREQNSDLFWGTFGGMGLLGIVIEATIRLRKIETVYFRNKAVRANDLPSMLSIVEELDKTYPYSVANLDVAATGARLGGGVLTVGDHATLAELPEKLAKDPLRVTGAPKITVPFELPEVTLNPLTIRALNAVMQQMLSHAGAFKHYDGFFFPLDMFGHWYRGYGRRGFTQYQFVIPFENAHARLRELLTVITSSGELPFLNVLKRLGKQSGGVLSFPCEGWTFAIDFPIRANTVALLRRLDAMVLDAGGRIYLGKDSYVEAAMFRAMYPNVEQFLALREKYDPNRRFSSDLSRRLEL